MKKSFIGCFVLMVMSILFIAGIASAEEVTTAVAVVDAPVTVAASVPDINVQVFLMKWGSIITSVIGVFALIANATPNKADDQFVGLLVKAINLIGGNFNVVGLANQKDMK